MTNGSQYEQTGKRACKQARHGLSEAVPLFRSMSRHTSGECLVRSLKFVSTGMFLRAVSTLLPASDRASDLLAGEVFADVHAGRTNGAANDKGFTGGAR